METLTQLFIWIDALHPIAFGLLFIAFCVSLVIAAIILNGLVHTLCAKKKRRLPFIEYEDDDHQWEYR